MSFQQLGKSKPLNDAPATSVSLRPIEASGDHQFVPKQVQQTISARKSISQSDTSSSASGRGRSPLKATNHSPVGSSSQRSTAKDEEGNGSTAVQLELNKPETSILKRMEDFEVLRGLNIYLNGMAEKMGRQRKELISYLSEVEEPGPSAEKRSRLEEGYFNTTPTLDSDTEDSSDDREETSEADEKCEFCGRSPDEPLIKMKCGVSMCSDCLSIQANALVDDSLPPECPRCGKRLSDKLLQKYIDADVLVKYHSQEKRRLVEKIRRLKKALDLISQALAEVEESDDSEESEDSE